MAVKVCLLLAVLAALSAIHEAAHHAAPPSVDCSSIVLDMADCLTFVMNGSTVKKPEGSCCSGLKTVLRTNAQCLCEAFKSSSSLGVVLDVPKALTLPSACHVSAPSATRCGLSLSPAGAPAVSPAGGPLSSIATAPAAGEGLGAVAPVPAPGNSGSTAKMSVGWILVALVAAGFSCF